MAQTVFVTLLLLLSHAVTFTNAGSIKVCVTFEGKPMVSADVECWDDDFGKDDYMAAGKTNSDGCVALEYKTKSPKWWDSLNSWDLGFQPNPDIFCEVSSDCMESKKTSTKRNHDQSVVADFGVITVEPNTDFCGDVSWNGCGAGPEWLNDIADTISGFESICNRHDVCYSNCQKTRSQCDKVFKKSMTDKCNGQKPCEEIADVFYNVVVAVGENFCISSRKKCSNTTQTCKS
jgi:Prokaryotic phospholipase A2